MRSQSGRATSLPLNLVFDNSATSYTAASDSCTGQPTLFAHFSLVLKMDIPALVELLSKTAKAEKTLKKPVPENRSESGSGAAETGQGLMPITLKPGSPPAASVKVDRVSKRPTLGARGTNLQSSRMDFDMDMAGLVELLAGPTGLTAAVQKPGEELSSEQPGKPSSSEHQGEASSSGDPGKASSSEAQGRASHHLPRIRPNRTVTEKMVVG